LNARQETCQSIRKSKISESKSKEKERTMRNGEWNKLVSVAGRILLAFLFVFSQSAWAGQDQNAKDKPKPAHQSAAQPTAEKPSSAATAAKTEAEEEQAEAAGKSSAEEKSSSDGKHEGIKVHGHWTIEVRNPDGTLVTHREFDNSLVTPQFALYTFLSRQSPVGLWTVLLGGGPAGNICSNPSLAGCYIVEPELASLPEFAGYPGAFGTLAISGSGNKLVLSGTATANLTGSVGFVFTDVNSCPPTPPPNSYSCGSGVGYAFTSTQVSPEIPVSAGQTVAVTVNISFS
jgi:hypothetical protein